MIKIMLIKDEYLQRELLKNIIDWKSYNAQVICEADNSNDAILLSNKYQPDVIFLDIIIHGDNGLITAKGIRKLNPFCQIIVITAFASFDYAREAITTGVCGYLLKPINPDELLQLFLKASQKALYDKSKDIYEKELLHQKMLYEMLTGIRDFSPNEMENLESNHSGFLNVIFIRFDFNNDIDVNNEMDIIKDQVIISHPHSIILRTSSSMVLFIIENSSSNLLTFDVESGILENDIKVLLEDKNISASVARSTSYSSVHDIRTAFQDALKKVTSIGSDLQISSQSSQTTLDLYANISEYKETISVNIVSIPKTSFSNSFQKLIHEILFSSIGNDEKFHLLDYIYSLLMEADVRNNYMPDNTLLSHLNKTLIKIKQEDDTKALEAALQTIAGDFIDPLFETIHSPTMQKIALAKKYIESHFQDSNLTLHEVALSLDVNQCYLSNIFKAQTGISFSNYLTKYRLDKSVELIKADSNKPLYQVSEEVGYSDYYYFCKCFRKQYGMPPSEFQAKETVSKFP